MLSLYGNIYTSGITADPAVLREVVQGGNLEKEDKAKITKAINKVEKEEEKAKMPAVDSAQCTVTECTGACEAQ